MGNAKIVLFIGAAIAAIAFAVPAMADEEFPWSHEEKKLAKEVTTKFSGTVEFSGEIGGYECAVEIPVVLEPGTTGTVENIEADTEKCEGSGVLEGCTAEVDTPLNLPYTMHATKTKIDVTNVTLHYIFEGECTVEEVTATFPSITIDPEQPEKIDAAFVHGKGQVHVLGLEFPVEASGTVNAEKAETYGIE